MYTNYYEAEMQLQSHATTAAETYRRRTLEAEARRQQTAGRPSVHSPRRPSPLVKLRLRLARALQPAEEGMLA